MARIINWSRYNWSVKSGTGLGPGPNNWSDSTNDVFVDTQGKLHLKISNHGGTWYCTEITSLDTFGYGTYIFNVDTQQTPIDSNSVLGLFTYLDDQNEVDIEFSQWGNPSDVNNAGFTVQPESGTYNQYNTRRFYTPLEYPSHNSFVWTSSNIEFTNETSIKSNKWSTNESVTHIPKSSIEKVHLNLWLYRGNPPLNNQQQEVVINNFQFQSIKCNKNDMLILGKCIPKSYIIYGGLGLGFILLLKQ